MTDEPVSTERARGHLRLQSDDPFIADLPSYIKAARMTVEQFLNATVLNRMRSLTVDFFPCGDQIWLPDGPVIAVTQIQYIDTNGDVQTVDQSSYRLTNYKDRDLITPVYGEIWPSVRNQPGAVVIEYMAGMMTGSPATLDNEDILSGILLTLGDIWNNREGQFIGVAPTINKTVHNLLFPYRRNLGI